MFSNGFFYSANDFYKEIFGTKVYKISLDAGCTCPNRDGKLSTGGCTFCSASGSGDFASSRSLSIKNQVASGKALVRSKLKASETPVYIAYFQNFSSTYGDEELLFKKFQEALECSEVAGLAVGTRPDCLSEKMLSFLSGLSEKTYVSIELGLQTSCEKSAKEINRCYENEVYLSAVSRLKTTAPRIHVVTHIIFGLPGESEQDMLSTVDFAVNAGTDGIKISLLHVLSGTVMAEKFNRNEFSCMDMEEYFEILGKALKRIPEKIVIHRVTGDGPKKILIAPLWTGNKKKVMNSMFSYFKVKGIRQGIN